MCILFFPISTILQGISIFNSINKVLTAILISGIVISFFVEKINWNTFMILFISVPLSFFAIRYMGGSPYNANMTFYLPFWIIYFLYMRKNYSSIMNLIYEDVTLLKVNVFLWNGLVFLSLFFPSSYSENWGGTYFTSFSNGEHRFASSCLFAFAMFWILQQITNTKKYYIFSILPLFGFLQCGARTYLGGAFLYLIAIYYLLCKNKKTFYLSLIPVMGILVVIILVSPIGEKIITTFEGKGYFGYWATLTSGRSMFWIADLEAFFSLNWWHQLVGNGLNYVFEVNEKAGHGSIWAHNDIINLLLSNGYCGVFLYLTTFFGFTRPLLKKEYHIPRLVIWGFFSIWIFNAFFNMVYTYTCTVLATPFILYSLCHLPLRKELGGNLRYVSPIIESNKESGSF